MAQAFGFQPAQDGMGAFVESEDSAGGDQIHERLIGRAEFMHLAQAVMARGNDGHIVHCETSG